MLWRCALPTCSQTAVLAGLNDLHFLGDALSVKWYSLVARLENFCLLETYARDVVDALVDDIIIIHAFPAEGKVRLQTSLVDILVVK